MIVEEAIKELADLFPEPEYTSEISLDTRGRSDVTVFSNTAECANVIYVDGVTVDACMIKIRAGAEEAKRLSRQHG